MYKKSKTMFLKVITPLHAGGENKLSIIDQPIQREVHNSFPKIEASTLKGCVRNAFEKTTDEAKRIEEIFGGEDNITAAKIAFSDARLLFFPVRSVKGVFAYITCPYALKRFSDDTGIDLCVPEVTSDECCLPKKSLPEGSLIVIENNDDEENNAGIVVLDEMVFNVSSNKNIDDVIDKISKQLLKDVEDKEFKNRVVMVSDDDFTDFVINSTEVITRIKIDNETGIVADQALFNEEYLPSESILYSLIFVLQEQTEDNDSIENFINKNMPEYIQIGANMTLGKGFTKCIIDRGDSNE